MCLVRPIDAGAHRDRVRARRDELIATTLPLVAQIARAIIRSLPPSFELDDIEQAGRVGLLHAATRYRAETGVPFPAFARKHVRGAILDHIAGRHPEIAEVPLDEESQPALAPVIDIAIDRERRLDRVRKAIGKLPAAQRRVIEVHYSDDEMDHSRTAEVIGIDRRRAGELHAAAVGRLRRMLGR